MYEKQIRLLLFLASNYAVFLFNNFCVNVSSIDLSPDLFFDLSDEPLVSLFENVSFVWEALDNIKPFFDSCFYDIKTNVGPNVHIENKSQVFIGKNCQIAPFSYIEGPCYIADGASIGHACYIRAGSVIGHHCHVGHASEVKNSILLSYAKAPHFNYVGDSIIGKSVNLGAGVVCANYKLNGSEVKVSINGEIVKTGRKKFGAILGDKTSIGCNSVTNPGTLTKRRFLAKPCSNISGAFLPKEKGALL